MAASPDPVPPPPAVWAVILWACALAALFLFTPALVRAAFHHFGA